MHVKTFVLFGHTSFVDILCSHPYMSCRTPTPVCTSPLSIVPYLPLYFHSLPRSPLSVVPFLQLYFCALTTLAIVSCTVSSVHALTALSRRYHCIHMLQLQFSHFRLQAVTTSGSYTANTTSYSVESLSIKLMTHIVPAPWHISSVVLSHTFWPRCSGSYTVHPSTLYLHPGIYCAHTLYLHRVVNIFVFLRVFLLTLGLWTKQFIVLCCYSACSWVWLIVACSRFVNCCKIIPSNYLTI